MADYSKKTQGIDRHLANLTSARYVHIDGSSALVTVLATTSGGRLLRVINSTKGLSLNLRSGSRVVGTIGTGSPEGTYNYGVYCENGIQVDVGGTGSATLVYQV
jgi:hypothetical protein